MLRIFDGKFENSSHASVYSLLKEPYYSMSQLMTHLFENGDDRARTDNLRLAKPALSQLSYVPGPTEFSVLSVEFLVINL